LAWLGDYFSEYKGGADVGKAKKWVQEQYDTRNHSPNRYALAHVDTRTRTHFPSFSLCVQLVLCDRTRARVTPSTDWRGVRNLSAVHGSDGRIDHAIDLGRETLSLTDSLFSLALSFMYTGKSIPT
jgi:hypothetical protein